MQSILQYVMLQYTMLQYTMLQYTMLQYTMLQYTMLQYTMLQYTMLQLYCSTLCYSTLYCSTLYYNTHRGYDYHWDNVKLTGNNAVNNNKCWSFHISAIKETTGLCISHCLACWVMVCCGVWGVGDRGGE